MDVSCFSFSVSWILLVSLLHGPSVAEEAVVGLAGRDVTLTCHYDSAYYGTLAVCWGKGPIPNSGCGNELIRSDGAAVTSRASERYVLRGDLQAGDVSLTVRQLEDGDAGTYGCRVDIPGWFNDHKHHTTLTVVPGPPDPVRLLLRARTSRTVTLYWAAGFDGGSPLRGYVLEHKNISDPWVSALRTNMDPLLTRTSLFNLQPFSTYNMRLFSQSDAGTSPPSNALTVTTDEEAPGGPPLDVQLEALSSGSLEVSWRPPRKDLQHGVIHQYNVGYKVYEDSPSRTWTPLLVPATGRRQKVVLQNLHPATLYQVVVQAINKEGAGPSSPQLVHSTLEDEHTTSTSSFVPDATSVPGEHEHMTVTVDPEILWEQTTLAPTPGQQDVSSLSTGSEERSTISTEIQAISSEDEEGEEADSHRMRVAGIVVPVVLLLLIVAVAILWQLKRLKLKKGNLEISWRNNGAVAFQDAQLLPDL